MSELYTGREVAIKEHIDDVSTLRKTVEYGIVQGEPYRLCMTVGRSPKLVVVIGQRQFFISTEELVQAAYHYHENSEEAQA